MWFFHRSFTEQDPLCELYFTAPSMLLFLFLYRRRQEWLQSGWSVYWGGFLQRWASSPSSPSSSSASLSWLFVSSVTGEQCVPMKWDLHLDAFVSFPVVYLLKQFGICWESKEPGAVPGFSWLTFITLPKLVRPDSWFLMKGVAFERGRRRQKSVCGLAAAPMGRDREASLP